MNAPGLIVSVYDATAVWCGPYIRAGYPVLAWDLTVEGDLFERFGSLCDRIRLALAEGYGPIRGFLFAPPCTHLCRAGARWRRRDDRREARPGWNNLEMALAQVEICLHLVELFPPVWWALENPAYGRLEKLLPYLAPLRRLDFDPCDFGDPYTKRTALYGDFNPRLSGQRCLFVDREYIHNMGRGKHRAARRSATPPGFAEAFFQANP